MADLGPAPAAPPPPTPPLAPAPAPASSLASSSAPASSAGPPDSGHAHSSGGALAAKARTDTEADLPGWSDYMRPAVPLEAQPPVWHGYVMVQVLNPQKEGVGLPVSPILAGEGGAFFPAPSAGGQEHVPEMILPEDEEEEVFVSYLIRGRSNLPHFPQKEWELRRRYRDFAFLHDGLAQDFPACVVPPLPDKHRIEYFTGDRFSPDFIHRRTADLNIFLERVCRHPLLMRTPLLCAFLSSNEWAVDMHSHTAASARANNLSATGDASTAPGLLDSLSDKIVNAFARVRKPDERFVQISDQLELFREALTALDGVVARHRSHAAALADDYDDMALAFKVLAELETGMAVALRRFGDTLAEMGKTVRLDSVRSMEHLGPASHALVAYAHAYQQVLDVRDAKQIDFEELAHYLSSVAAERDRLGGLAYGAAGRVRAAGITGYLRDSLDHLRGVDEERTRVERMQRLEARLAELQDAVSTSHGVLTSFTQQVLSEALLLEYTKQHELQDVLSELAGSKVALYQRSVQHWDRMLHSLGAGP